MHTKDIGNIAELSAAKKLISNGKSVSFPFGDNERYDLIFDDNNCLYRAQVRKGAKRDGYIVFKCYSNHRSDEGIKRDSFKESEIECFLVWCKEEDKLYRVPVEETPKTEMRLRLDKTGNNQKQNVNWASDYLVE